MREVARVMKIGGALAVVDLKPMEDTSGPPVSIRSSPKEVDKLVTSYGFQCRKVVDVGPYHYIVIFRATGDKRYI